MPLALQPQDSKWESGSTGAGMNVTQMQMKGLCALFGTGT